MARLAQAMARPAVIDAVHRPWVLYSCRRRARDRSGVFLADGVGSHPKLRSQFHLGRNGVGNEAVFLDLVHDRPSGLEVGPRFQDDAGPNADLRDPIPAVDVFQETFSGAFISRKLYAFAL